jgi:hypothetical protein
LTPKCVNCCTQLVSSPLAAHQPGKQGRLHVPVEGVHDNVHTDLIRQIDGASSKHTAAGEGNCACGTLPQPLHAAQSMTWAMSPPLTCVWSCMDTDIPGVCIAAALLHPASCCPWLSRLCMCSWALSPSAHSSLKGSCRAWNVVPAGHQVLNLCSSKGHTCGALVYKEADVQRSSKGITGRNTMQQECDPVRCSRNCNPCPPGEHQEGGVAVIIG